MTRSRKATGGLAALLLATLAGGAMAETAMRFDSVDPQARKAPVSLLQSVREATKDMELPAVVAAKDATTAKAATVSLPARKAGFDAKAAAQAGKSLSGSKLDPAFWGNDGQWCNDNGTYVGGPCDNTGHWRGGGERDPYARDPSREGWGQGRSPYDNPWNRDPYYGGGPYGGNPYGRDPYGRDPYGRDPYGRDPYRGPYRGPYRRY